MQTTTEVEEAVLEKMRSLPPEKQRTILDFAEFLVYKYPDPLLIQAVTGTEKTVAESQGIDKEENSANN